MEKKVSKFPGVFWVNKSGKWRSQTGGGLNRRTHGEYDTEEEAAWARHEALIQRYGFDPDPPDIPDPMPGAPRFKTHANTTEELIRRLAIIYARGVGSLIIKPRPAESKESLYGRVFRVLPLVSAQPYVSQFRLSSMELPFDVDLDTETIPYGPWLFSEAAEHSKILLHHTCAKAPSRFWMSSILALGDSVQWIGPRKELQEFRAHSGSPDLKSVLPKNWLEAAEIIQGCDTFLGNRSTFSAIAEGLGKTVVLDEQENFVAKLADLVSVLA